MISGRTSADAIAVRSWSARASLRSRTRILRVATGSLSVEGVVGLFVEDVLLVSTVGGSGRGRLVGGEGGVEAGVLRREDDLLGVV